MKNKWYEKDSYAVILVRHIDELKECLIDLVDLDKVATPDGTWTAFNESNGNPYVKQRINGKIVRLHRLILEVKPGEIIDHINRNTFDNRRENLRVVSSSGNAQNRVYKSKTGVRNVHKQGNRFRVILKIDGKMKHFGYYGTLEEAEEVAKKKRSEYFPYATE
jgi:HNH endonuclease